MMPKTGFLLLVPLSVAANAFGQAKPNGTVDEKPDEARAVLSAPAPTPRRVLAVSVDATGYDVSSSAVRIAIAKELGIAVSGPKPSAEHQAHIDVTAGGDLILTLKSNDDELVRVVSAPSAASEVPELAALLVGNLARDEAQTLLFALQPKPADSAPSAGNPSTSAGAEESEPVEAEAELNDARPELEQAQPEAEGTSGELQTERATRPEKRRSAPTRPFNFSVFHPAATLRDSERYTLNFELGLAYGRFGGLSGFALTPGVTRIDGEAKGVQVAALGSFSGGPVTGAAVSGLVNYAEGSLNGVQIAGLAGIHGPGLGYSSAGLLSLSTGAFTGVQNAGALSVVVGPLTGGQLAGVATYADGGSRGLQAAGITSVSRKQTTGAQISGIANITQGALSGAQVAGVVNYAGDVSGLQLGLVNVGRKVSGLQLGLVNIADEVEGVSIGLVPYEKHGRTQLLAWFGGLTPMNVGVRFHAGALYVMPTLGLKPEAEENSYSPGISLGGRVPFKSLFLDFEVNYSNPSEGLRYNEHVIDLRYRSLAGVELTPYFGVFAGGGLRQRIVTTGDKREAVTPELSAGIQFF